MQENAEVSSRLKAYPKRCFRVRLSFPVEVSDAVIRPNCRPLAPFNALE